ncbi:MAG: type II toxin-antitoxin system VapC family toxin [Geminicoccaceae bacterium]
MTRPRFLLDTTICICIRRQRPPEVLARFRSLHPGKAANSVIAYGELHYGAERSAQRERALDLLQQLVAILPVLSMPQQASMTYGAVRADLERRGKVIGNNDLWIAAHALAGDLILATNKRRAFARIHGLQLANWVDG